MITACPSAPRFLDPPPDRPERPCPLIAVDVVLGNGLALFPRPMDGCAQECSHGFVTNGGCVQIYTDYETCCALPQLAEVWLEQAGERSFVRIEQPDSADGGQLFAPVFGSGPITLELNGCWGTARVDVPNLPPLPVPRLTETTTANGLVYAVSVPDEADSAERCSDDGITGGCCEQPMAGLVLRPGEQVRVVADDGEVVAGSGSFHFWRYTQARAPGGDQ